MAWAIYGDTEKHGSGKQWEEGAKQAKSSLVACYATFRSEASSEDLYRYIRNAALTTLETPSEQTEHKEANALWQKYYMREETSPPDTLPNLEPTLLAFAFTIATNFNDLPATPGKPGEFVVKSGSEIDIFVVSDQQGKYWAYNTDTETMFPYAYYIGRPDLQADRETPHFYLFADRYDEAGNALYKASDGSLSQSAVVLLAMAALQVETDKTGAATTAPPQATTPADKPQGLATVSERMGLDKLTIPEGNYGSSAGNLRRWYTDQQICDAMTENEIEYWVGFGEAFEAEIYGGSGTWFESDEEVRGIHAAAPYIQEALRTADTGDTRENILKQAITEGEHLCGASLVDIAPGIAAYRVWIASQ
ncbi:MAG: hypothetical protein LBJ11_00550 [Oscillospiraceae bacterium]|nr:hypothetical protein [Oscillospiraceae bacterium]